MPAHCVAALTQEWQLIASRSACANSAFGEDYIRFSYANSLEAITEAVERIRNFLGNLPRGKAS